MAEENKEPLVNTSSRSPDPKVDDLMTDEVKNRLIEFLRWLFSNSERYHFDDDEVKSKIWISDQFPDKEAADKKPALIVRRENLITTNRGIGHFLGWTGSKNFGERFVDLFRSQVTIECYSREGLEAEKIANMVFMSFLYFRRELRQVGRVHDVLVANLGGEIPQRVTSKITLSMFPVQLSFAFTEMWITEEVGRKIFNGITVDAIPK